MYDYCITLYLYFRAPEMVKNTLPVNEKEEEWFIWYCSQRLD